MTEEYGRIYLDCSHIFKVSWWLFWEYLGILWEFFGNSLEFLWKFFGNSLGTLWEFFGLMEKEKRSLEARADAFSRIKKGLYLIMFECQSWTLNFKQILTEYVPVWRSLLACLDSSSFSGGFLFSRMPLSRVIWSGLIWLDSISCSTVPSSFSGLFSDPSTPCWK